MAMSANWSRPQERSTRRISANTGVRRHEGLARCVAIMGRVAGRPAYARKMGWLMPRMAKAVPYLGYIL